MVAKSCRADELGAGQVGGVLHAHCPSSKNCICGSVCCMTVQITVLVYQNQ